MKAKVNLGGKFLGNILSKLSDLLFPILLLGVLFLAGCKKDSTTTPEALSLQVFIGSTEIQPGDSVTVTWLSNGTSAQIMLNGEILFKDLLPNGSKKIGPLFQVQTDTLTVLVIRNGQPPMSENKTVKVLSTKPPTVIMSVDSPSGPWNTSFTTTVQISSGADSSKSNIPGFHGSGSYSTVLRSTTIYHVIAYNKYGITKDSITITVLPQTFMDIIVWYSPWSEVSGVASCTGDENGPWPPLNIGQEEKDTKYVFHSDGKWDAYQYGVHMDWGTFSISDKDSTLVGFAGSNKIIVLDSTAMTLKHKELGIGCPGDSGYTKRTYGPTTLKK